MAMVMQKHTRELKQFLRAEYGAENLHLEGGGRHAKLKFRCHGSEYSYIIGNPSDGRAIKNIHAELKRKLGPPASARPKHHTDEIDMAINIPPPMTASSDQDAMLQAQFEVEGKGAPNDDTQREGKGAPREPLARTWEIKVSAYGGISDKGPTVWFMFPRKATDYIKKNYSGWMAIEKLDDENWKITARENSRSEVRSLRKFNNYENGRVKITYVDPGTEPFGASFAEAVEANGEILIFLAKQQRMPLKEAYQKVKPQIKPITLKSAPVVPEPAHTPPPVQQVKVTVQQPVLMTTSTLMEKRMLDIIRQIYDIEELCPYRLVRLENGRLSWRAPEISWSGPTLKNE